MASEKMTNEQLLQHISQIIIFTESDQKQKQL
jgi:hypothetical protein